MFFDANGNSVQAARGDGNVVPFWKNGQGLWTSSVDVNDQLQLVSGVWRYRDMAGSALELYDANGRLTQLQQASGPLLNFSYSDTNTPASVAPGAGYLLSAKDAFGRHVDFTYKGVTSTLVGIATAKDTVGQTWTMGYDGNGNLTSLTTPDTPTAYSMGFVYDSPNANQSWALTGLIDEQGKRWQTYGYNSTGQAVSTELAGGVDKYVASYANGQAPQIVINEEYDAANNIVRRHHRWSVPQPPSITTPTGAVITHNAPDLTLNYPRDTGKNQPAGSGCSASSSAQKYDASGNLASQDDFNGHRTCYAYSTASSTSVGNLEVTRVEGLANTVSCDSVTPSGATLPTAPDGTAARKISTQWHPDWAIKIKEAQPYLLTTWVYSGQTDPFTGQTATCVTVTPNYGSSSTATLPDGKPIAVLCKKKEQATKDANGSQGLTPTLDTTASTPEREWNFTYNQYGQVLTSTDPLGNVTTYSYYTDGPSFTGTAPSEVGHYQGDLKSVTNAQSHATQYTSYDRAGRVLSMTDPNGLVTSYTYWPRGWIKTVTQGGLTTSFDYWPTGLLKQVKQPDGSTLAYTYDDAHRLTDVTDNLGNTVHYTLDNAGNRTAEDVKDTSGALTRNISRTYDNLNRLWTIKGGMQ